MMLGLFESESHLQILNLLNKPFYQYFMFISNKIKIETYFTKLIVKKYKTWDYNINNYLLKLRMSKKSVLTGIYG